MTIYQQILGCILTLLFSIILQSSASTFGHTIIQEKDSTVVNETELSPKQQSSTVNADWIARAIAIVTMIVTIAKFYIDRKKTKEIKQLKLTQLLREARDQIGGDEGTVAVSLRSVSSPSERKKLELARRKIDDALIIDKKSAPALYHHALYFLKMRQLDDAINSLNKALKIDRDYPQAHNAFGTALKLQGKLEKAIQKYNKAITIDPFFLFPYINLGNTYDKQENLDDAIAAYEKATSIDPTSHLPYIGLGNVYSKQGAQQKAINAYKSAMFMEPNNHLAYLGIANCLFCLGKLKDSIGYYHTAISLNPYDISIYLGLGNALTEQGNKKEAKQIYLKAIDLNPKDPTVYIYLGDNFALIGDTNSAIKAYRGAIRAKSDYAKAIRSLLSELDENTMSNKEIMETFRNSIPIGEKTALKNKAYLVEAIDILQNVKIKQDFSIELSMESINQLLSDIKDDDSKVPFNLKELTKAANKYRRSLKKIRNVLYIMPQADDVAQLKRVEW